MAALRLSQYLSQAAKRGFVWGEHDCILFAADWASEVSGEDPAWAIRGHYANAVEAKELLGSNGGMELSMNRALAFNGGWHAVRPQRTGDIVLVEGVDHAGSQAAGIAVDRGRVALLTRRGLVVAPRPVLKAWRYHG